MLRLMRKLYCPKYGRENKIRCLSSVCLEVLLFLLNRLLRKVLITLSVRDLGNGFHEERPHYCKVPYENWHMWNKYEKLDR